MIHINESSTYEVFSTWLDGKQENQLGLLSLQRHIVLRKNPFLS